MKTCSNICKNNSPQSLIIKDGMKSAPVDNFGFRFFIGSAIFFNIDPNTRQNVVVVDFNICGLNGFLNDGAAVTEVIGKYILTSAGA